MFTGIIEEVGIVEAVTVDPKLLRLHVAAPRVGVGVGLGDSVAVNGVCLTVTRAEGGHVWFDAVRETLDCSALGDLVAGSRLNLERALQVNGRLDGHIVQGHVDGVGAVARLERQGDDVRLFVDCSPSLAGLLVDKGSVTIDGVSLTVVTARPDGFDVVLIPHTLRETTLGEFELGRRVNLEADILGKYVKSFLERTCDCGQSAIDDVPR